MNFEPLKMYSLMSENEKLAYLQEVKNWTENDYPELCRVVDAYTQAQVKSFEEGLRLLSAFNVFHTFIRDADHYKDYRRRLSFLGRYIEKIRKDTGMDALMTRTASDTAHHYATTAKAEVDAPKKSAAQNAAELEAVATTLLGERPAHIDQYVTHLSAELQTKVADIATLRASYAADAEMAKTLSEMGADKAKIAEHADRAVRTQEKLVAIYQAINAELAAQGVYKAATAENTDADTHTATAEEKPKKARKTKAKKADATNTTH